MEKKPDLTILFLMSILLMIGIVMIFSASSPTCAMLPEYNHDPYHYLKKHMINLVFGIVGFWIFSGEGIFNIQGLNIKDLKKFGLPLFVISVISLLIVLVPGIGIASKGARRWLGFGSFTFQPAEFAKLFCIIFLAINFSKHIDKIKDPKYIGIITLIMVIIAGVIEREPDLGTALSIAIIFYLMLYISGASKLHLSVLAVLAGLAVTGIIVLGGNSYRVKRLISFLDPWKDSQDTGYHVCQSLIAVGSGGVQGLGLGESRQKFFYLPEQHTDFIFAITGEELGLIGTIIIVLLFVIFMHRGFKIASETNDLFLRLLAVGCTSMIALQAFLNMGVVIGLLPCTGIPLPFISYGGSSLIVSMMMMGIIFNISRYCSREGIGWQYEADDEKNDEDSEYTDYLDAEEE